MVGSAESVGRRTTMSVVQSILAVIVVDAAFSVAFSRLEYEHVRRLNDSAPTVVEVSDLTMRFGSKLDPRTPRPERAPG